MQYKGSLRRWPILLVIFLATANCLTVFVTLQPLAIPIVAAFEVRDLFYVNMTIMAQVFAPIPMTFVSIWVYSHFKVSDVLRVIVSVQMFGAALRSLCTFNDSYEAVAIGSILVACCNAFFINAQTIIVNKWFTDKERALATALYLVASPIGGGASFGMTGLWFKNVDMADSQEFLSAFKTLMITQFIITAGIWIMFNLIIKEKPDIPPSAVAEVRYEPLDFKQSIQVMRENSNFFLLIIAYSLPFGSFLAVGALVSSLFDPFGFRPSEVSFICLGLLVFGVVGAVGIGPILDRTKKYKICMHICTMMVTILTGLLVMSLNFYPNEALPIVGLLCLGGVFATSYLPLCFSYASELTFPTQPALINGMLTMSASVSSFFIGLISSALFHEPASNQNFEESLTFTKDRQLRSIYVVSTMTITALIAFGMSFFIKEDLKRLNYSRTQKYSE